MNAAEKAELNRQADEQWHRAMTRGAARAAQAHHEQHEKMRGEVRRTTSTAVACLQELRVQHAGDGNFVNGVFVPSGVSRHDVALAFQRPTPVPPKGAAK